ncbi:MAG: DUF456 domain-containing protein [Bacteroidia bacterium]|nr:DUF456 domain-containing protein [Bacteroidia bacterium]MCZ2277280.1 DUF456 domain-containing protein [Bacteroidia bacterium]
MDYFLIIIALLLCITGIAGCILPGLPGPPFSYLALWFLQWAFHPFSIRFLVIWLIIVIVVSVLDYYLPIWTAKRFGATRQGIILSIVGMLVGIFFTPVGMIGGLIAGAILGDLIAGRSLSEAFSSGGATVFGTLLSIGLKLIVSGILVFYTIVEVIAFLIQKF